MRKIEAGTALRALDDGPHCGDQCGVWINGESAAIAMVDGLGHGPRAEEAATAAVDFVARNLDKPVQQIIHECDLAIRSTRGVAMGIAMVDYASGEIIYAAVGNTRGLLHGAQTQCLMGHPGIVGSGVRKIMANSLPVTGGDLIILWTDGIAEYIAPETYDADTRKNPDGLARGILQDYSAGTDDAGVLVLRI